MTHDTQTDRRIRIKYPIPLDVSGNLLKALGTIYPDAAIRTDDPWSSDCMVIDVGKRTARTSKAKMTDDLILDTDGTTLTGIDDKGWNMATPREAMEGLAWWAQIVLENSTAPNYVEQEVFNESDRRFLVTACWSPEQTPHQLRMAAEARIVELEARISELEAR